MSTTSRTLSFAATLLLASLSPAADVPGNSPFETRSAAPAATDSLEFAGVSTVGKKTMINLYDKEAKQGHWVAVGATADGITVVKYDSAHDQVTVRRNGAEKTLPLRPPSAVANGPAPAPVAMPAPVTMTPVPVTGTASDPSMTGQPTTAQPASPAAPVTPEVQAKQEQEARMLVSDLLEIGMAQRRAYEEAQRKAAESGNQPQPAPAAGAQPAAPATAAPAPTSPPAGG